MWCLFVICFHFPFALRSVLVSLGFGFDADNGDIATKAFQQSDLNTRAGDSQRSG